MPTAGFYVFFHGNIKYQTQPRQSRWWQAPEEMVILFEVRAEGKLAFLPKTPHCISVEQCVVPEPSA